MPKADSDSTVSVLSPLHNLSAGDIIDELGGIKAAMADLKSREDILKAQLIERGVKEAEGALFRATLSGAARWTLDTDRVKREMGAAWFDARSKVAMVTSLRVSARKGLSQAA